MNDRQAYIFYNQHQTRIDRAGYPLQGRAFTFTANTGVVTALATEESALQQGIKGPPCISGFIKK